MKFDKSAFSVVKKQFKKHKTLPLCSPFIWKVISIKSLLYVINVVIKKNAVSIKKKAVFCKRSLKYPA